MKKLISFLIIFIALVLTDIGYSRVKLPEFSFTGKEIGSVYIKPVFPEININFKSKSTLEIYLEKIELEQKGINQSSYESEEPGFMFGGTFRTALASIFIGNKAYRNYIVKKFINKEYLYVIDGYEKYSDKLKGGDFENEIKLLYAIALMETGNINNSLEELKNLSQGSDNVSQYSQDKIFDYFTKIKDNNAKLELCGKIKTFSEYGLYNCIETYYKNNRFDDVITLVNNNKDIVSKNSAFANYKIASLYMKGELSSLINYDPNIYKDVAGYIADAYIEKGDLKKAEEIISKIVDPQIKLFYGLKISIIKNNKNSIIENFNKIENDRNKLFLLLYYINKHSPEIDLDVITNIKFENPIYYDYTNFYSGIFLLNNKRYDDAGTHFQKISFYKDLEEHSIFYLAVCYYYTDYGLSDIFFRKYLEIGKDKEKLTIAKYMLGQFLFIDKKYQEALNTLKDCDNLYCNELRAEIYFNMGDYQKASAEASHIVTDRGYLIAASSLFNLQNYQGALIYLKKIEKPTRDSDLILMLTFFKLLQIENGLEVYKKYNHDREFTDNAVKYLYLNGNYNDVVNILRSKDKLTNEQELLLANSYFSLGKTDDALKKFTNLIDKKLYIYESAIGIFSLAQSKKDTNMIEQLILKISNTNFENKDMIIFNMIRYLKENGDPKNALKEVNFFFKNFPASNYLKDAYLLRSYIYTDLGLYDECIKDADRVLTYNSKDEEAKFVKAECLKHINKNKAIDLYIDLANKSKRFEDLSKRAIVNITDDPNSIKEHLSYFKERDKLFYYDITVRMLGLLEMRKEIVEHEAVIDELIATRSDKYVPVGYYYKSIVLFSKGNFKESLNYAMKCYYLFPKSPFTLKAMNIAMQIYKKNNDTESMKKVEEIIKKLDKGGN